jgi:hypothetical protein
MKEIEEIQDPPRIVGTRFMCSILEPVLGQDFGSCRCHAHSVEAIVIGIHRLKEPCYAMPLMLTLNSK